MLAFVNLDSYPYYSAFLNQGSLSFQKTETNSSEERMPGLRKR